VSYLSDSAVLPWGGLVDAPHPPPIDDVLREHGQKGWELIAVIPDRHEPFVHLMFVQPWNVRAQKPLHVVPDGSRAARRTTSAQPRPNDFLPGQKGPKPIKLEVFERDGYGYELTGDRGVQPWDDKTSNRYQPIEDVLRYYGERGWELYGLRAVYRRPWEVVAFFQRPVEYSSSMT
jgi:hypothetical protein